MVDNLRKNPFHNNFGGADSNEPDYSDIQSLNSSTNFLSCSYDM
jgi:hypothetical protein